ncbi:MAG: DMT family transporter [Neomegalonema sp.]|nr:DMT family transporter [Neomegalonema sp.]
MLGAVAAFTLMGPMIKLARLEGAHVAQIVFLRLLFALLLLAPLAWRRGLRRLKSGQPRLQLLRGLVGASAMFCAFSSFALIPIAEATAIGFASPLFATIAAVLWLGERIRARRIAALIIGFVGVVIILRPGAAVLSEGALLGLFAAAQIGAIAVLIKKLSTTDSPEAMAFWMAAIQTPVMAVPAIVFWTTPSWLTLICCIGLALTGSAAHLLWARASQLAEVSQLQPIEFAKLPMTALIAYLAFSEAPSLWTWAGGGLIAASTGYIAMREARLAKRATPSATAAAPRPVRRC